MPTDSQRKVHSRDRGTCQLCGKKTVSRFKCPHGQEGDVNCRCRREHLKRPWEQGGQKTVDNMEAVCGHCYLELDEKENSEHRRVKNQVKARDNWRCVVCRSQSDLTAHHVKYRSRGGRLIPQNLITLCGKCHVAEHKKTGVLD